METTATPRVRMPINTYRIAQIIIGVLFSAYLIWRIYQVFFANPIYGPDTWIRLGLAGLVLGSVYALIAIQADGTESMVFTLDGATGTIAVQQ